MLVWLLSFNANINILFFDDATRASISDRLATGYAGETFSDGLPGYPNEGLGVTHDYLRAWMGLYARYLG